MAAPNIVNVTSILGKSMGAALGTSANTDILTCASDKVLKINSIIVSNVDGTNQADVTLTFYDNSAGARYHIAKSIPIQGSSSLTLIGKDNPLYLEESDQIEGSASATNDLEVIISYEEIDDA